MRDIFAGGELVTVLADAHVNARHDEPELRDHNCQTVTTHSVGLSSSRKWQ